MLVVASDGTTTTMRSHATTRVEYSGYDSVSDDSADVIYREQLSIAILLYFTPTTLLVVVVACY